MLFIKICLLVIEMQFETYQIILILTFVSIVCLLNIFLVFMIIKNSQLIDSHVEHLTNIYKIIIEQSTVISKLENYYKVSNIIQNKEILDFLVSKGKHQKVY